MSYELFIEQASLCCCTSAIEKDNTTQIGTASVGLCKTRHAFIFVVELPEKMLVLFAFKMQSVASGSGLVFSVDLYPSACVKCVRPEQVTEDI